MNNYPKCITNYLEPLFYKDKIQTKHYTVDTWYWTEDPSSQIFGIKLISDSAIEYKFRNSKDKVLYLCIRHIEIKYIRKYY